MSRSRSCERRGSGKRRESVKYHGEMGRRSRSRNRYENPDSYICHKSSSRDHYDYRDDRRRMYSGEKCGSCERRGSVERRGRVEYHGEMRRRSRSRNRYENLDSYLHQAGAGIIMIIEMIEGECTVVMITDMVGGEEAGAEVVRGGVVVRGETVVRGGVVVRGWAVMRGGAGWNIMVKGGMTK